MNISANKISLLKFLTPLFFVFVLMSCSSTKTQQQAAEDEILGEIVEPTLDAPQISEEEAILSVEQNNTEAQPENYVEAQPSLNEIVDNDLKLYEEAAGQYVGAEAAEQLNAVEELGQNAVNEASSSIAENEAHNIDNNVINEEATIVGSQEIVDPSNSQIISEAQEVIENNNQEVITDGQTYTLDQNGNPQQEFVNQDEDQNYQQAEYVESAQNENSFEESNYNEPYSKSVYRGDVNYGEVKREVPVVVQAGDSLSIFANLFYGSSSQWGRIYGHNQNKLNSPDHLAVNQKLLVPIYKEHLAGLDSKLRMYNSGRFRNEDYQKVAALAAGKLQKSQKLAENKRLESERLRQAALLKQQQEQQRLADSRAKEAQMNLNAKKNSKNQLAESQSVLIEALDKSGVNRFDVAGADLQEELKKEESKLLKEKSPFIFVDGEEKYLEEKKFKDKKERDLSSGLSALNTDKVGKSQTDKKRFFYFVGSFLLLAFFMFFVLLVRKDKKSPKVK